MANEKAIAKSLREQANAKKKAAADLIDRSEDEGRDLTRSEARQVDELLDEYRRLEKGARTNELVHDLANSRPGPPPADTRDDYDDPSYTSTAGMRGSRWAKAVVGQMNTTAGRLGVKTLLSGEITTPPTVEVVDLPANPIRLLDLVARRGLDQSHYSYLREIVRDENVGVVADGAVKPTSIYTFEEVEDRARVVAHLSEPFPLRYLADHRSMTQVLDAQMRTGVLRKVEEQLVSGDGLGENFTGILYTTGVTDVGFDTDALTTVRKARTALEAKGENPTAWVVNPSDVEAFDLIREDGATGGFLMNSGNYEAVFGRGVSRVSSLAVPAGTAILADWSQLRLLVRQAEHTLAATQAGDLFARNQVMLRAEGRYGIELLRPQAFAVVDLTGTP
jgi:HK97 family phage major capsid protein